MSTTTKSLRRENRCKKNVCYIVLLLSAHWILSDKTVKVALGKVTCRRHRVMVQPQNFYLNAELRGTVEGIGREELY
jgi:hypothetical protein